MAKTRRPTQSIEYEQVYDRGVGCQLVSSHRIHEPVIYFAYAPISDQVKIGVTTSLHYRLGSLSAMLRSQVVLLAVLPGKYVHEQIIHRRFADVQFSKEWFQLDGPVAAFLSTVSHWSERIQTELDQFNRRADGRNLSYVETATARRA